MRATSVAQRAGLQRPRDPGQAAFRRICPTDGPAELLGLELSRSVALILALSLTLATRDATHRGLAFVNKTLFDGTAARAPVTD